MSDDAGGIGYEREAPVGGVGDVVVAVPDYLAAQKHREPGRCSLEGEIASVGFETVRSSERSTNSQFTIFVNSFFGMQGNPFPIITLSPVPYR